MGKVRTLVVAILFSLHIVLSGCGQDVCFAGFGQCEEMAKKTTSDDSTEGVRIESVNGKFEVEEMQTLEIYATGGVPPYTFLCDGTDNCDSDSFVSIENVNSSKTTTSNEGEHLYFKAPRISGNPTKDMASIKVKDSKGKAANQAIKITLR